MRRFLVLATVLGFLLIPAAVKAEVDPEMQAWLDARDYSIETTFEKAAEPGKANCWHAKVFSAIRNAHHDRLVWAWNKGIVCQSNGHFYDKRQAWDHGSPGTGWHYDTGILTEHWQRYMDGRQRVYSHYLTGWQFGSDQNLPAPEFSVTLNLNQFWTGRVDRKVKWFPYR